MIPIQLFKNTIRQCILTINAELQNGEPIVNLEPIFCVDEKHAVKALKDSPGIIILCKLASSDTKVGMIDNYSEENEQLIYVIEKWSDGAFTNQEQEDRYEYLQSLMSKVKTYLLEHFSAMRAELATPFHTEYEYQQFGSFYGLSTSFSLKDFEL
ncbi:MAG: hypothetical protein PHV20_12210 [Bacteroidales bacterium]|nr:hypothetical protein [Bacteroidales bacterium]